MRIAVFTEGTILMAKNAVGHTREEIVRQVEDSEPSVKDYRHYVPVGNAAAKIKTWINQGAEIIYMTSRRKRTEIEAVQEVLDRNGFPKGRLVYRQRLEQYKDVAERIAPDVLIEDDCESIGGVPEMTYPHIKDGLRAKIRSVVVREFGGIDHLPDDIEIL